jgi:hypothetical protein
MFDGRQNELMRMIFRIVFFIEYRCADGTKTDELGRHFGINA